MAILEKKVITIMETMYKALNATNIHKSFYRKKDLVQTKESDGEDEEDTTAKDGPFYDSEGNELMEHKSKNTMNDMLPNVVKAAEDKEKEETLLGKRTTNEVEYDRGDEDGDLK